MRNISLDWIDLLWFCLTVKTGYQPSGHKTACWDIMFLRPKLTAYKRDQIIIIYRMQACKVGPIGCDVAFHFGTSREPALVETCNETNETILKILLKWTNICQLRPNCNATVTLTELPRSKIELIPRQLVGAKRCKPGRNRSKSFKEKLKTFAATISARFTSFCPDLLPL